ncbi:unnamed protein product [Effrenium voratum]|nr:unnamed protein product [Effrenium voratum]
MARTQWAKLPEGGQVTQREATQRPREPREPYESAGRSFVFPFRQGWYIHIGKRCIFAGMALESPETCLRQPEREGFKGPGRPSVPSRARAGASSELMAIPVFDIDLDEDPALRWRAVAAAGAHLICRVGLRWDLGGNSSQFVQVLVVLPIWDILPLSWSNRTEGTVRGDKNRAQAYAPHLRKLAEAWLLVLSPALGGGAVVCFRVSWELRREWQVAMATAPARSASRRRGRKAAVCAERRVARVAQQEALQLLQRLQGAGGFLAQLFLELRGVAEAAEVPLQALCSLSLQYEAYCACTAVAARMEDGSVALARTLDWEFPELKALNIDIRVFRGGRLLYTATTWAGYIGVLTAQRPGRYALAVNFREEGAGEAAVEALPVGLAVRQALERCEAYGPFLEDLASVPAMAPFYCLVCSEASAAQITRDVQNELQRRQLEEDVAFLVQANMDHWDSDPAKDSQQSLVRCKLVEEMLQAPLTRGFVEESELWAILWKYPVYETGITLYSTVMNPAQGLFRSLSEPPEEFQEVKPRAGRKKSRKCRAHSALDALYPVPKRSFVGGAAALCLDVNRCMALCDATPGCYAVEVSQAVDRCQLKRSSCLMPEHWHNADTNLLVVGRVRHETTTTPEPGPAVQGTLPNRSREHRPTAAQVLLRASRLVEKAAERDAAEQQLRTKAAPQLRKNQVVAEATLQRFAALAEFSLVDITQESSSRSYKYSGAVRRDCTLYLVPFNADSVGIFDTARRSFRTVSIPSSSEFKYSAGVMVGDVAYFVPYAESHIGVFDTATEQFRALDVSWASSAECKYSGALTASSAVYFVPSSAENIGVLDPSSEEFRTIGLGPGADAKWKYHGGVIYDGRCYFAPYNADHIGVLDIASESFHTIDISHAIERDTKFSDAFAQKGVVYFVPFTADGVGAWDVASRRFRLLGLANGGFGGFKFLGAVQVGALSYFVPDSADGVGVFHAATQGFASYDVSARVSADSKFSAGLFFNGAVYLVPRNAHSIGILQVNQSHAHHCPAGTTTQVQVVLGDAGDAGDGLGLLPDGDERYFSGSALPLLSWEAFQALAVILAALLAAELARRAKGESLASCIVAALLPTVLYFVARGLLDLAWPLPAPFWVQMLPASASFLLFWLLFQAVLLWPSANSEDSSARLDWVDLLACMAGLAAADAANAYAQPDTGRSQAAVLAVASALLWGLDSFTGSDSKLRRSPALVLPLALLALEVLSRAVLGFLDIEVLDQEGYLQDGLSHGVPGVGSGLLLAGLSVLLLAVGLALPGEAERAVAVAVATAALAALRAARWLAKSFGLRPDEGHELIFAVVMTALADLALMGLQKMLARTRSGISAEQLGPHGLGLALGLAWASRLLRACAALAPNPSPWALLLALLVALLMLWILAQPRKGQGYSQVKVQPKVKDRCPDAGHLRLYRGIEAAPVLCPPQLSHGEGGELQPGPRLCLEEPGLSLFVDL